MKKFLLVLVLILAFVLRIWRLDSFPPALYTDEAVQGYDAFSILRTGKDQHGAFLPLSLRSFGDWKPPLPTYLMIPFVALFGLSEWSVRLPSVVTGLGSIVLIFLIVQQFKIKNLKLKISKVALLASFYLAISPWHVFQSRTAMLVMVAFFFYIVGLCALVRGKRLSNPQVLSVSHLPGEYWGGTRWLWMIVAGISFGLCVYSYYGMRLIVPITLITHGIGVLGYYRKKALGSLCALAVSFAIILFPLGIAFLHEKDVVFGRARTVSIFYDQGVKLQQWDLITRAGVRREPAWWSYIRYNSPVMYTGEIIKRFSDHLTPAFLFTTGDRAQPFEVPGMGVLYGMDLIVVVLGMTVLFFRSRRMFIVLLGLGALFILPAALTFMTPSANRTFNLVAVISIGWTLGVVFILSKISYSRSKLFLFSLAFSIIAGFSLQYFLNQYFLYLPIQRPDIWNFGWKEVVAKVSSLEKDGIGLCQRNDSSVHPKTSQMLGAGGARLSDSDIPKEMCRGSRVDTVVVPEYFGMPYIYFLFYTRYDPARFQKEALRSYVADEFGYEHVEGFGRYVFPRPFDWKIAKESLLPNSLYVMPVDKVGDDGTYFHTIYNRSGKALFRFFLM